MRGLRRGPAHAPGGHGPVVLDARVLDGEHLLLAVRGTEVPLVLRGPAGEVDLPTSVGADREGPLTTATVLLTDHAGPATPSRSEVRLEVLTRTGRGRPNPVPWGDAARSPDDTDADAGPGLGAPSGPDGTWRWEVGTGPDLVLTRRPEPGAVPVLALRGRAESTEVLLAPGPDLRVEVRRDQQVAGVLPLEVVHDDVLAVAGGARALRLGRLLGATAPGGGPDAGGPDAGGLDGVLHADGHPLARRLSHLARPQRATELPPLPPAAGLELRWTPAGHLALRGSEAR